MGALADVRIAWRLLRGQPDGADHRARLDGFYVGQADDYDRFRERLLHGRAETCALLGGHLHDGCRLAEIGAGTGRNLEFLAPALPLCRQVWAVDLCPSLLQRCRQRVAARGWDNVEAVEADATAWRSPQPRDAVLFSYSLTMIPDWFAAIDAALATLRPGGIVAVVDFYVSRPHPDAGLRRHGALTRRFWPAWFGHDGVNPSPDHLPYLRRRCEQLHHCESSARLPMLPLLRAPWYGFVGRKRLD